MKRKTTRSATDVPTNIGKRCSPSLTTSAPTSCSAASICFRTNFDGTTWISCTPSVFCAVSPVVAVRLYTPWAVRTRWSASSPLLSFSKEGEIKS